jgi:hypothetical protein
MKDLLLGFLLGYWLKDKIDPEKMGVEEKTPTTPEPTSKNTESSNLTAGLWLAGVPLGIGLPTLFVGWYLLTFICVATLIAGISMMLTPEKHR